MCSNRSKYILFSVTQVFHRAVYCSVCLSKPPNGLPHFGKSKVFAVHIFHFKATRLSITPSFWQRSSVTGFLDHCFMHMAHTSPTLNSEKPKDSKEKIHMASISFHIINERVSSILLTEHRDRKLDYIQTLQAWKHPLECSRWVPECSHCFHRGNLIKEINKR